MPIELSKDHLKYMNLGRRFWGAYIDGFTSQQNSKSLNSYLNRWPEYIRVGMGVFVWGSNSVGKTYVSAALCKAVWGRYRVSSYMVTAEELKDCWINKEIEAHPGSTEFRSDRIRDIRFLVIDDLAKEYRTESGFAENKLSNLLRERQKNRKVTSITTNLSPTQFKQVYGNSAFELVKESMIPCKIDGENMRERVLKEVRQQIESGR